VCITPPPNQILFASDAYPHCVYKLTLDGKLIGVLGRGGQQLKQFGRLQEIVHPFDNKPYVASC